MYSNPLGELLKLPSLLRRIGCAKTSVFPSYLSIDVQLIHCQDKPFTLGVSAKAAAFTQQDSLAIFPLPHGHFPQELRANVAWKSTNMLWRIRWQNRHQTRHFEDVGLPSLITSFGTNKYNFKQTKYP